MIVIDSGDIRKDLVSGYDLGIGATNKVESLLFSLQFK